MFIKIGKNVLNLNSITAITKTGTDKWQSNKVHLLGGGYIYANKEEGDLLLTALENKMTWYEAEE